MVVIGGETLKNLLPPPGVGSCPFPPDQYPIQPPALWPKPFNLFSSFVSELGKEGVCFCFFSAPPRPPLGKVGKKPAAELFFSPQKVPPPPPRPPRRFIL